MNISITIEPGELLALVAALRGNAPPIANQVIEKIEEHVAEIAVA